MDYTASMFLMDAKGGFFGTISCGEQPKSRLEKLRRLLAESSA